MSSFLVEDIIAKYDEGFSPLQLHTIPRNLRELTHSLHRFESDLTNVQGDSSKPCNSPDLLYICEELRSSLRCIIEFVSIGSTSTVDFIAREFSSALSYLRALYIHPTMLSMIDPFWKQNMASAREILYRLFKIVRENPGNFVKIQYDHQSNIDYVLDSQLDRQGFPLKYQQQAECSPPKIDANKDPHTIQLVTTLEDLINEVRPLELLISGKQRNFVKRSTKVLDRIKESLDACFDLLESNDSEKVKEVSNDSQSELELQDSAAPPGAATSSENTVSFAKTNDFLEGQAQLQKPPVQTQTMFRRGMADLFGSKQSKPTRNAEASQVLNNTSNFASSKAELGNSDVARKAQTQFFM